MTDPDEVKLLPCRDTQKIAEIVHGAMVWAAQQTGQPKPWQNGNSYAEDRAREAARAIEATRPPVVTDEVVEQVAKAIFDPEGVGHPDNWNRTQEWQREFNRKRARAAIASMPAVVSGGQT